MYKLLDNAKKCFNKIERPYKYPMKDILCPRNFLWEIGESPYYYYFGFLKFSEGIEMENWTKMA